MNRADISLDRAVIGLFSIGNGALIDMTDSVKKLNVLGVAKTEGEQVTVLGFTVEELPAMEGEAWVQKYQVNLDGIEPIRLALDTQRATLSHAGLPIHTDLVLTIGVETENMNQRPQ